MSSLNLIIKTMRSWQGEDNEEPILRLVKDIERDLVNRGESESGRASTGDLSRKSGAHEVTLNLWSGLGLGRYCHSPKP